MKKKVCMFVLEPWLIVDQEVYCQQGRAPPGVQPPGVLQSQPLAPPPPWQPERRQDKTQDR